MTAPIAPIYTDDEWIVMTLVRIQTNKHGQTMRGSLFMNKQSIPNNLPKQNSISVRAIKISLMSTDIYTILCFFIRCL